MSLDLVSIGNVNIDLIFAHTRRMPEWGEELLVPDFEMRLAGSAGYFAVASARLGAKCGLIGSVGDDVYGRFMLKELKRARVKPYITVERGEKSGICVSIVRDDGERAFVSYLGNLSKLSLADVEQHMGHISQASALYYGGYFWLPNLMGEKTKKILGEASKKGVITSFDTGWDPEGWKPSIIVEILSVLENVDIFLPNFEESRKITGCNSPEDASEKLLKYGPQLVAIKLGPQGCLIKSAEETVRANGFKVKVFDTTGAGDAFNAALMLGFLKRWSLERTANFANATGALTVSMRGKGAERFPTSEMVENFLEKRGHKNRLKS